MIGLKIAAGLGVVAAGALLFTFERPPVDTVQRGYRGTAMAQVYNPALLQDAVADNQIPATLPRFPDAGPKAGAVYKNVQVLKNDSVGNFTRVMASMTTWVAPKQGCAYCHNLNNMASDEKYTKVVARRMLQMVRHVNGQWTSHVAGVGVTCWTCHRGQNVPSHVWYDNPPAMHPQGLAETNTGKNMPGPAVGLASLPNDPFTPFLENDASIRVQSHTALPTGDRQSIKQTEWTYALMMHFAQSLGVNCTYCHNSRAFSDWSQSSPQRMRAWYGIRMVRDLNVNYLDPLHTVFPQDQLGASGDSPKLNCATCHKGVYKPLFGVSMIGSFPELVGPASGTASTATTTMPPPAAGTAPVPMH